MKALVQYFLALLLFAPGLVIADEAGVQEKQLKELKLRMKAVEKRLLSSQKNKSQQEVALRKIEKNLGLAAVSLRKVSKNLAATQSGINGLQQKQLLLIAAISEQKSLLAEQLRSAFLMGRQQQVKLVLNQEQPERLARVMKYHEYFNQARIDNVAELEAKIAELKNVEVSLKAEQFVLQDLVNKRQAERNKLKTAKARREKVLIEVRAKIKSTGNELQVLKENEKRLGNLLRSIRQAINDIPIQGQQTKPFSKLKGQLAWPLKGSLKKRFGNAKKSGRWDGVLIAAKEGQAVRSISHGRVVYADWLRGYGLLIIIDHGEGYMSLYAFNQGLYREVGDWVDNGEQIASSGLSGGQQSAGLYFSIRKNGKPINPIHWCRGVKRGRVG